MIMMSIIRVRQSKFVTVQINEDSNERIMNCIKTLSELESEHAGQENGVFEGWGHKRCGAVFLLHSLFWCG
jgi:vesicle coat complex subunit